MKKRCVDGCQFLTRVDDKCWCKYSNIIIENRGRYCKNFKKANWIYKLLTFLGL